MTEPMTYRGWIISPIPDDGGYTASHPDVAHRIESHYLSVVRAIIDQRVDPIPECLIV